MIATLLALTPLLAPAAPALAADGDPPPPTLVDVRLSRDAVTVSGLRSVPVTVSVHLKDPAGVVETSNLHIPSPWPDVVLRRTSGGRPTAGAPMFTVRDLDLTSGTPQDGIWTTTVLVPSTWEGTWQVTSVTAENDAGGSLHVDPRTVGITRSLTVVGTHQPSLSINLDPAVTVGGKGPVAVKGRAVDADTGRPVAGLLLTLGTNLAENCGAFGYGGSAWTTTDARGYYAFRRRTSRDGAVCVIAALPQRRRVLDVHRSTTLLFRVATQGVRPVVSAAADSSTVTTGGTVAVRGRALAAASLHGRQVVLQRLVGRTWRQVGTSRVRSSGRYTLYATPPARGLHLYRVLTGGDGFLTGVSPTLRITAR